MLKAQSSMLPWPGIRRGRPGIGMIGETGYSVPAVPVNSMSFWKDRFEELKVDHQPFIHRFGETMLPFEDREGLRLNLHFSQDVNAAKLRPDSGINKENSVKGFKSISLMLKEINPTAKVLTEILGYTFFEQEGHCYRYSTNTPGAISVIDLIEIPKSVPGLTGAGTYHHIAFRVKDETELMSVREFILQHNLTVTEKIDRNYFYSIYFREPGGVLFEIATDSPGFSVDEPLKKLGKDLKLPAQYEQDRKNIESVLPLLNY